MYGLLIQTDRDLPVTLLSSLLYMVMAFGSSHCPLIFVWAVAWLGMSLAPFMLVVVVIIACMAGLLMSVTAIYTSDGCASQAVYSWALLPAVHFDCYYGLAVTCSSVPVKLLGFDQVVTLIKWNAFWRWLLWLVTLFLRVGHNTALVCMAISSKIIIYEALVTWVYCSFWKWGYSFWNGLSSKTVIWNRKGTSTHYMSSNN